MFCSLSDYYLPTPKNQIESKQGNVSQFSWAHASMQGWRRTMEDSVICLPNFTKETHLFGVLDGHGGSEVASVVAQKLPQFLKANKKFTKMIYEEALTESFEKTDQWLRSEEGRKALIEDRFKKPIDEIVALLQQKNARKIPSEDIWKNTYEEYRIYAKSLTPNQYLTALGLQISEESGTTANIILITNSQVYCANIGDSRSVSIQKNKPVILSFDHKPEDRIERSRIKKAGGFVAEGRVCGSLALSRAFADFQYKEDDAEVYMVSHVPDITVHETKNLQMLLLACDGIWEGQITDYGERVTLKVFEWLQKGHKEAHVLHNLMNDILAKQLTEEIQFGLDNMTCILINFNNQENKIQHDGKKQQVAHITKKIRKLK